MSSIKFRIKDKGTKYTLQDISNYLALNRNTPIKDIISELVSPEENARK